MARLLLSISSIDEGLEMEKIKRHYRRRSNPIIEECMEEGISVSRWMKWHGVNYPEQYRKGGAQKGAPGSDDSRSKSSWANWLNRVNDI